MQLNQLSNGIGFYVTIGIFSLIVVFSIVGFFIEHKSLGTKRNSKAMVDAFESE
jgi:thiosulfate reductase cytochrome b subunit